MTTWDLGNVFVPLIAKKTTHSSNTRDLGHILYFFMDLLYMIQTISRKNNRDVLTPKFCPKNDSYVQKREQ